MARRKTILDQIYPVFLTTLLVVVALSIFITYRVFRGFQSEAFEAQLRQKSELLGLLFSAEILENDVELETLLSSLQSTQNLTVRLYGPDGQILPATGEPLPPPPESVVRSLLGAGAPTQRALRDRTGTVHVLEPIPGRSGPYLLAASRSERPIIEASGGLISTLVLSGFVMLLSTSVLLAHLVNRLKRPLETLQRAASAYAKGDLDHRFQISRPQEMALLAETMNGMAEQLTSRIRAISSQRNQLEAMLSGMVEGVILVGGDGRIRTINEAACELFSVSEAEAVGQPVLAALRNSELYDFYQSAMTSDGATEGGIQVYHDSNRFLQAHGTLLTGEGNEKDVLIVLNDITRIKRLETIRQEFVANVSHELKTPITSILGFVETLQDGAIEEPYEARTFLDIIANHTRRLNTIIDDLLQLARLEQSEEELPAESVDIRELVGRAVEAYSYAARQKGITIEVELDPLIERLEGNRNLLERALTNLIDNAIKYSPSKTRVVVRTESKHAAYGRQSCAISVTDQGPGIPPIEQARVFERFYRLDKTRSRELGGTGLGLAIVKHVALIHGGTVDLESERGEGSTFIVEIPRKVREELLESPEEELQGADYGAKDRPENVNPL